MQLKIFEHWFSNYKLKTRSPRPLRPSPAKPSSLNYKLKIRNLVDESRLGGRRLCDRFGLLHKGRLVCTGTLPELRAATGCSSLVEMFINLVRPQPALKTTAVTEGKST